MYKVTVPESVTYPVTYMRNIRRTVTYRNNMWVILLRHLFMFFTRVESDIQGKVFPVTHMTSAAYRAGATPISCRLSGHCLRTCAPFRYIHITCLLQHIPKQNKKRTYMCRRYNATTGYIKIDNYRV